MTWKQFLVHMATIVLGLLIAITLEQSVEALHHRHQRHQLEEDVRQEARLNVAILDEHLRNQPLRISWFRRALDTIQATSATASSVDVILPPDSSKGSGIIAPQHYVWPVAQSSGAVALLPTELAQVYARLEDRAVLDNAAVDEARQATYKLNRLQARIHARIIPDEKLHVTQADRAELIDDISAQIQTISYLVTRDQQFRDFSKAIADGASTLKELYNATENTRSMSFN